MVARQHATLNAANGAAAIEQTSMLQVPNGRRHGATDAVRDVRASAPGIAMWRNGRWTCARSRTRSALLEIGGARKRHDGSYQACPRTHCSRVRARLGSSASLCRMGHRCGGSRAGPRHSAVYWVRPDGTLKRLRRCPARLAALALELYRAAWSADMDVRVALQVTVRPPAWRQRFARTFCASCMGPRGRPAAPDVPRRSGT